MDLQEQLPEPKKRTFWYFFPGNWKFFAVFLLPIALCWIRFLKAVPDITIEGQQPGKEYYCTYVMVLTGLYWTLDCMPLAATAFVPLIVFPLFFVELARNLALSYMQDVGMMTFASSILILAAISSGLSKRIACKILSVSSCDFRRIMFVCMLLSALFSCWFVNTAIMIFMMDVVEEIIIELGNGVDFGTLGDSKMSEWNLASSESNDGRIYSASAETGGTKEEEIQNQINPNPSKIDDIEQLKKANPKSGGMGLNQSANTKTSIDSLEAFADDLGDTTYVEDRSIPASLVNVLRSSSSNESQKSKALGPSNTDFHESNHSRISHQSRRLSISLSRKSKTSLVSTDSLYVAPVPEVIPVSEKLAQLKEGNDNLLQSYKINLFHGIAIAGNIGGLLWPYGSTSSTAIFYYYRSDDGFAPPEYINQAQWMNFTFPIALISFAVACLWIDFLNFKVPKCCEAVSVLEITSASVETRERVQQAYKKKYALQGKVTSHEMGVLVVIILSVALFVLDRPIFVRGWSSRFEFVNIKDSTVAALAVLIAFIIPKCGFDGMFRGPTSAEEKPNFTGLVLWKNVQQTFPWGLLIFIGGGTAIAHACVVSKFNEKVVNGLHNMIGDHPYPWLILLISIIVTTGLAHFLTSTAAAHISAHILMQLSMKLNFGWCYLPVPCVIACSFAFLVPAGTPPIAIAHMKTNKLSAITCFKRGWPLTIFCVSLVYGFGLFYTDKLMQCGRPQP